MLVSVEGLEQGAIETELSILPRKGENPLFEILGEDDGYLFSYDHPVKFDLHWTDGLIKQLEDAKKYWNKIKDTYKYN